MVKIKKGDKIPFFQFLVFLVALSQLVAGITSHMRVFMSTHAWKSSVLKLVADLTVRVTKSVMMFSTALLSMLTSILCENQSISVSL